MFEEHLLWMKVSVSIEGMFHREETFRPNIIFTFKFLNHLQFHFKSLHNDIL